MINRIVKVTLCLYELAVLDDFNFITKTEVAISSDNLCAYGNFHYNNQCLKWYKSY